MMVHCLTQKKNCNEDYIACAKLIFSRLAQIKMQVSESEANLNAEINDFLMIFIEDPILQSVFNDLHDLK